mgnify:CR=1 FL=1
MSKVISISREFGSGGHAIAEGLAKRFSLEFYDSNLLEHIAEQPEVTVTWFQPDERKEGGAYLTVAGRLKKLDKIRRVLVLTDGTKILLANVVELESEYFQGLF